jgi:hypothetical protein
MCPDIPQVQLSQLSMELTSPPDTLRGKELAITSLSQRSELSAMWPSIRHVKMHWVHTNVEVQTTRDQLNSLIFTLCSEMWVVFSFLRASSQLFWNISNIHVRLS